MTSEAEKMVSGELYDPNDPYLLSQRSRAQHLCQVFNATPPNESAARQRLLTELFADLGEGTAIQPPFFCDYGTNITLGKRVFFNVNCVILDVCKVRIGDYSLFGPAVQIYTATHPMNAGERRLKESGKPLVIGSDVWVGGGAILLPGISIGDGAVVGAGSVVTRDVPAGVLAAGNPCRVIRRLTE